MPVDRSTRIQTGRIIHRFVLVYKSTLGKHLRDQNDFESTDHTTCRRDFDEKYHKPSVSYHQLKHCELFVIEQTFGLLFGEKM